MDATTTGTVAITATAILGALSLKATDFAKFALSLRLKDSRNDGINGLLTLVLGALLGVVVVIVVARTQWGDEITVGSTTLDKVSGGSLFVLGLVISSFAGTLTDFKKAIDKSDTASTPAITQAAEKSRRANMAAYFGPAPEQGAAEVVEA